VRADAPNLTDAEYDQLMDALHADAPPQIESFDALAFLTAGNEAALRLLFEEEDL